MWQLKVYCLYNEGFDQFLKEVVQLILSKYGFQLNIESLKEIELVNKNTYSYETDGKVINNSNLNSAKNYNEANDFRLNLP